MDFKELIFISGKGGTGKSTLAIALARFLSQQGKSVLLVELEEQSSVRALVGTSRHPSYKPSPSGWGFDWCRLLGRDCLVEYVSTFTRLESVTQKFFDSPLLKTLVNVAPGLNDLSILGKLTSRFRQHGPPLNYDHVIIDAPSTGSFYSLIKAPVTLGQSVTRGPLHSQSKGIDEVLRNKDYCQFFFVSLFEELSLDELEDTLDQFSASYGSQISVVMNKSLPIAQTSQANTSWGTFIKMKITEENNQSERAKDLWQSVYKMPLFTKGFPNYLENLEEVLRPL